MDDLVAALHLLAQKLRVDVHELAERYVLYTQISAIVLFIVYLICAYVAYKVIDYCFKQYTEADPMRIADAKRKLIKDELKREVREETDKITRDGILAGVRIARIVLMALIMGSFLIGSAAQISSIIFPRGKALEEVMESLADATKVEIVKEKESSSSRSREKERADGDTDDVQQAAPDSGEPVPRTR